jgi:predicted membrane-bound mannosyltransferase
LLLVIAVVLGAAVVGILWDWKRWLIAAGIFAAIYVPLYTTLFTNPQGLATGMVGSLGYWLVQQGVQRGTQPLYYYLMIEIPVYEYLVAIGGLVAAGMGIAWLIRGPRRREPAAENATSTYNIASLYPLVFGYWSPPR